MDFIIVAFVMTAGTGPLPPPGGYIEPVHVRRENMVCMPGSMTTVQVDRAVNPTVVLLPHPDLPDQHCRADITARVATLKFGEYHIATTYVSKLRRFGTPEDKPEPFIMPDPHTSASWRRAAADTVGRPGRSRIQPPPQ